MVSSNSLKGKFAVVTGASSGIGAATSLELARRGAIVVVHYHKDVKGAESVRKDISAFGGKAFCVGADLGLESDRVKLKAAVAKLTKKVDILVNNAGFYDETDGPNVSAESLDRLFSVHATAALRLCALLRPLFSKNASIVNVSSIYGSVARTYALGYSASKAALHAITQGLSEAYAPIRVNTVSPGPIDTRMWSMASKEEKAAVARKLYLKRFGRPDEVASVIAFLASDDSSYVTGVNLLVDGGSRLM